jgi:hypothetical protein
MINFVLKFVGHLTMLQMFINSYILSTFLIKLVFQLCLPMAKLVFDPFPKDPLDFSPWFKFSAQSSKSNEHTLKIKNSDGKTGTVSHLAMYLMAWCRNLKTDIWDANDTDIGKLAADAILEQTPSLTEGKKVFLKEDEAMSISMMLIHIG